MRTIFYICGKQGSGKSHLVSVLKDTEEINLTEAKSYRKPIKTSIACSKFNNIAFTEQVFDWENHDKLKKHSNKIGALFMSINFE